MNPKTYEFTAAIQSSEHGGAYVPFPYDIRAKINKQVGDSVHVVVTERA